MPMINWVITTYKGGLKGNWVYYVNPNFKGIYLARSDDDPKRDHMATDDGAYYYFGVTREFNTPDMPLATQQTLLAAWRDYFTVST